MNITKIIQVCDIHIRNFQRHKEYKEVFQRLFDYIRNNSDDETIIFLGGDIVHSKTDMTPELVSLASFFLKSCADLCTTILICGNHDVNLANQSRLDALTPLVESLRHPNLHYWKDTGVYELGNINFSVYSVFGKPTDWVPAKDINSNGIKIALHHGAVLGSSTDLGHTINNEYVKTDLFSGYDLVLLGDIHKRQFLNEDQTICYAGSLIQQSHGETLGKGIVVWDVQSKTPTFIEIPNDYGYATLHVINGKVQDNKEFILSLPKRLRLRIKYQDTTLEQIQSIVTSIKKKHTIEELSLSKIKTDDLEITNSVTIEDVRDIEYQNRLITEYVSMKSINHVDVDYIRHINRNINSELNSTLKLLRNIQWRPIRLQFSNMFSYGPNNVLNLEQLTGIQGIFAQNAAGKSSLLDIFTYCIYDKCSRAYKSNDVLNNKKTKFNCKLELELNGDIYIIDRTGFKSSTTDKVRVEVDFYRIDDQGQKHLLNGDDRNHTNKIIRDYLGTYDDFLLTTLSTQNDNKNFIFKKQGERKELVYSFLDLSVFESLQSIAKVNIKTKSDDLNMYVQECNKLIALQSQENYDKLNSQLSILKNNETKLKLDIEKLQTEINEINTNITPIDQSINLDSNIFKQLETTSGQLAEIEAFINNYHTRISSLDLTISNLESELLKYNILELTEKDSKNESLRIKLHTSVGNLKTIQQKIQDVNNIIEKLNSYEYDENCVYCVKNEFVKDAIQAKQTLPDLKLQFKTFGEEIDRLKLELSEYEDVKESIRKYQEISNKLTETSSEKARDTASYISNLTKQTSLKETISKLQYDVDRYNLNIELIEKNKKLVQSKEQAEGKLNKYNAELTKLNSDIIEISSNLIVAKNQLERINELKTNISLMSSEVEAFNVYIDMVSNDGLPYMILQKILPVIESEVNLILSDIVDFTSRFESDDKNNINCYLVYPNENTWPVEMASGMERFIISIAIRCALVDITSLPRPTFMAIDEGFGVLDSEKISSMETLFNYMRTKFDFVIAVSHVDTMRDMVDGLIDIHKNSDGFSEVKLL